MARAFENDPSTRNAKMSRAYSNYSIIELKMTFTAGCAYGAGTGVDSE